MKFIKQSIKKEEINEFQKVDYEGKVVIVNTPEEAEKAATYLKKYPILGIDTETRPCFKKGHSHQVALLQIANEEMCFLIRLNKTGLTLPIIQLLENPAILKIGLSLHDDFSGLNKRAPLRPNGIVELQDYVKGFGITDMSLQKIYAILFGAKISKAQRLSNWEASNLTLPQQEYAAIDAWACIKIYQQLKQLKDSGDWELIPTPVPAVTEESNIENEQNLSEAR